MKFSTLSAVALVGLVSLGAGATVVLADEPIRFVEAREIDFEGELKDTISAVGFVGEYESSTVDNALALGKALSEIGTPGRNAQVAAALCAIYDTEVETRRQNFEDYYNSLINLATLGDDADGQYAEPIANAIEATYTEDPEAFEVYVLGVASVTQECQE